MDQVEHTIGDRKIVSDPWQGMNVFPQVNAALEKLMIGMEDELRVAFDAQLGTEVGQWTEITLHGTIKKVVAQASSRFTVGIPLCKISIPVPNYPRRKDADESRP